MMTSMQLTIYTGFSELPEEFDRLFQQGETTSIFFSKDWFQLLVDNCLSAKERLHIYAVRNSDGAAVLCLPCYYHQDKKELFALENFYCSLFSVLGDLPAAVQLLTKKMAQEAWNTITLKPMAQGETFDVLNRSLQASGLKTQTFFCFGNWFERVQGRSFEEYYQSLSSKLKNTVKRRQKKLDKETDNQIVITQGDEDLEKHIADFVSIYNRSWKEPEPFVDFIPNFVRLCRDRGWLRLGLIYVDGKPGAAQLWTVHRGIAYIYKLAYDEAFSRYSIGSILTKQLMIQVIDQDGVEEIDYLTGDDNYKKDWMSRRRERWGIVAYNTATFKGFWEAVKNIGGRRLKKLFHRGS